LAILEYHAAEPGNSRENPDRTAELRDDRSGSHDGRQDGRCAAGDGSREENSAADLVQGGDGRMGSYRRR
jgi:hypothetical protein